MSAGVAEARAATLRLGVILPLVFVSFAGGANAPIFASALSCAKSSTAPSYASLRSLMIYLMRAMDFRHCRYCLGCWRHRFYKEADAYLMRSPGQICPLSNAYNTQPPQLLFLCREQVTFPHENVPERVQVFETLASQFSRTPRST